MKDWFPANSDGRPGFELEPPEDKNADRLAAIQDRIDDLMLEIEELERQYDYIASGERDEDLRAEAMERMWTD